MNWLLVIILSGTGFSGSGARVETVKVYEQQCKEAARRVSRESHVTVYCIGPSGQNGNER